MESQQSAVTVYSPPSVSSKPVWSPHPYQRRAISLLLSQASVGLFMDPGLGKTSTVLAALKILKAKNLLGRCLIIAPLRVCQSVWPGEIQKWKEFEDLSFQILHGSKKDAGLANKVDIHLINPEGMAWLAKTGKLLQYDVLVIDESSRFKDAQTQRFKALKPFLGQFKRRWILTGTPAPNGLMDLFGQMYILDLGRSLGRFITHYRREFFIQSGYGGYTWSPQYDAHERIVDRVSPLILQLSAEDYLQMPDLIPATVHVDLPEKAMKIYKDLEDEFITEIQERTIIASSAAVAGVKCRQVANGALYDEFGDWIDVHSAKLEALESLLEELGGAPVLVLYEFEHDKERIQRRIGGKMPVPILGSGTSEARLESLVSRFNAGDIPVLLGHPASMGHGLNLQGSCHHVIWFGIPWNLEHYEQAIARVYRQGQKSDRVFVYHIAARGTLDEKVLKVLGQKDKTQRGLLSALSAYRHEGAELA